MGLGAGMVGKGMNVGVWEGCQKWHECQGWVGGCNSDHYCLVYLVAGRKGITSSVTILSGALPKMLFQGPGW